MSEIIGRLKKKHDFHRIFIEYPVFLVYDVNRDKNLYIEEGYL